eukprot:2332460-Pyramimonas_sp.AAC.1
MSATPPSHWRPKSTGSSPTPLPLPTTCVAVCVGSPRRSRPMPGSGAFRVRPPPGSVHPGPVPALWPGAPQPQLRLPNGFPRALY